MLTVIQRLDTLFKSSKPHHLTVGFLILILLGLNAHLYAEQQKVSSDQSLKADKQTISEMMQQTKELIDIQRQSQLLQGRQWQDSVVSLSQVESRLVRADSELQSQIYSLRSEQTSLSELIKSNNRTSEEILKKLDALDKKVSSTIVD